MFPSSQQTNRLHTQVTQLQSNNLSATPCTLRRGPAPARHTPTHDEPAIGSEPRDKALFFFLLLLSNVACSRASTQVLHAHLTQQGCTSSRLSSKFFTIWSTSPSSASAPLTSVSKPQACMRSGNQCRGPRHVCVQAALQYVALVTTISTP